MTIDIDALVRQASTRAQLDLANLPVKPMFWSVLIEPLEPKERTSGGVILAQPSQDAQKILTVIGKILAVGSLAFTGKTASGISLGDELIKAKVGDHVLYQRYTGQELYLYDKNGGRDHRLVMITDSEILGLVTQPEAFRIYV
jgi:co-chaperonin GroES (HSP10)